MKKRTTQIERKAGPMLIEERRQHVLSQIHKNGRVLVAELSDSLSTSRITIRKDLDNLEARGLLQRTHGGALAPQATSLMDPTLKEKQRQRLKEKLRIAEAAAKLVHDGQCVLLDSGTTTTAVAQALRRFNSLTVITNAVNIATELASTNFEVILIGGTMRKNSFSLVGPLAEEMLGEIHADILFLGVDGFDPAVGVTTPNVLESRVNRAMVKASRRVVAVCDSTKFDRRSLALIVPPSAIHTVITDRQISEKDYESLRSSGIDVIRA
ncbi:transcriptional repressor AgaR [Edaphobacter modestus]|nr:transcriptional repressor AgaR [Edaphobacter modestus]